MRKTIVTVGAAVAAFLMVGTGVASAGWHGDYLGSGIRIRSAPVTGSTNGLGYPGQGECTTVAQLASDGYYWGYHRNDTTGVIGWSRGDFLSVDGSGCSF
ncbi:hypothetical protein [Amycolatopsis tolypomycina]|uniref:SH3 domain-containing protein n=1 Tax=Amycolatopsis tolypomycina TaxID=208445 RepID=A0A1H4I4U3_9PSEU|nr:hypothetical protein [Amycolatopsis tolypomycina]SEB29104.1 hypothetical protein SAMN04489727_0092 [Amycolatopsis tolypomycina]